MRPVAHTPGQLAAAAAFVQAWQAPTPAPVADDAGRGATASSHRRRPSTTRRGVVDGVLRRRARHAVAAHAQLRGERDFLRDGELAGRAEPAAPATTAVAAAAPTLALLACALASGRASFRRDPPRPVGLVLPVRGVGLADRLLM